MKKILLYGGSFNPPHLGHVHIAEAAVKELCPDELLIMPAGIPPHKKLSDNVPAAHCRFEMAELAFGHIKNVRVSDWEINRGQKNYTVDTLGEILKRTPDARVILLLGTDMFLSVESWYHAEILLSECELAVLSRNEKDDTVKMRDYGECLEKRYGTKVHFLKTKPMEISSTQVRQNCRKDLSMVPPAVGEYIRENGLYGINDQG